MALIPAIYHSTTTEAFFTLLTITPSNGQDVLRVVNNLTNVVSRGDTFEAYPFSIVLPSDVADAQSSVTISIDAVDQRIIETIRAFEDPPDVKIELVLSSTPSTVDKSIDFLRLVNVSYDALTVTGTLQATDFLNQPASGMMYSGTEFPSLVWG